MIREARADDEAAWLEIRNEPEARFWAVRRTPITPEEHAAWFRWALANPRVLMRVAEFDDDGIVGYAKMEVDLVGTVSFGVAPNARGRGIGGELLRALDGADGSMHVTRQAWVHPSNIPSVRAFMRRGYMLGGEPGYQLLTKKPTRGLAILV